MPGSRKAFVVTLRIDYLAKGGCFAVLWAITANRNHCTCNVLTCRRWVCCSRLFQAKAVEHACSICSTVRCRSVAGRWCYWWLLGLFVPSTLVLSLQTVAASANSLCFGGIAGSWLCQPLLIVWCPWCRATTTKVVASYTDRLDCLDPHAS